VRRATICLVTLLLAGAGCGSDDDGDRAQVTLSKTDQVLPTQPEDEPSHAAPTSARGKLGEQCASCHTLRAAGATGEIGPNLDERKPSAARVRQMIRTGSADGVMPAGLLKGRDARRVASYVARVAGR
jgi:mono/diheme cytochrome c family protein